MNSVIIGQCVSHGNVVALCPFCQIETLERVKAELKELRTVHAYDLKRIRDLEAQLARQS